jgi:hypothetical protein
MNACERVRFQCILLVLQNYYEHLEKQVQKLSVYLFFLFFTVHLDIMEAFSYSPTDVKLVVLNKHCSAVVYSRKVQHTHTNKDLLIYATTTPPY